MRLRGRRGEGAGSCRALPLRSSADARLTNARAPRCRWCRCFLRGVPMPSTKWRQALLLSAAPYQKMRISRTVKEEPPASSSDGAVGERPRSRHRGGYRLRRGGEPPRAWNLRNKHVRTPMRHILAAVLAFIVPCLPRSRRGLHRHHRGCVCPYWHRLLPAGLRLSTAGRVCVPAPLTLFSRARGTLRDAATPMLSRTRPQRHSATLRGYDALTPADAVPSRDVRAMPPQPSRDV